MTRWIVLPLCLVLAGVAGAVLVITRPFPDEHDGDDEQ